MLRLVPSINQSTNHLACHRHLFLDLCHLTSGQDYLFLPILIVNDTSNRSMKQPTEQAKQPGEQAKQPAEQVKQPAEQAK